MKRALVCAMILLATPELAYSNLLSQFSSWLVTAQGQALVRRLSSSGSPGLAYFPPRGIPLTQYGPVIRKPGKVAPVCQLTGGYEQWQTSTCQPGQKCAPPSITPTQNPGLPFGQFGTDLGIPITNGGRTFFYFGDNASVTPSTSGGEILYYKNIGPNSACNALESSANLASCPAWAQAPSGAFSAWGSLDNWGYTDETMPGCPTMHWPTNDHGPKRGLVKTTIVWENGAPMNTSAFNVPTGGFSLNGANYLFYSTDTAIGGCPTRPVLPYMLRSVLAKTSSPDGSDPVVLYTASQLAGGPSDPCNPQPDDNGPGKFINVGAVVWDGKTPSLPDGSLPFEGPAVFFFGTSWRYRLATHVYLAVVSQTQVESRAAWRFYQGTSNGKPIWTSDESAAAPIFSGTLENPTAELSASYNPSLHSWIVLYGGASIRSASLPWGPWSEKAYPAFDAWADKGYCHFMHGFRPTATPCTDTGAKPKAVTDSAGTVQYYQICMTLNGQTTLWDSCDLIENNDPGLRPQAEPDGWGGNYGAYIVDTYTRPGNSPDTSDVYFMLSTWVPYQAWMMKATFAAMPYDGFEPNDTWKQAASIRLGTSYDLTIHSPDDVDYLRITVPGPIPKPVFGGSRLLEGEACGTLDVKITASDTATHLQLLDACGETSSSGAFYPSGTTSISYSEDVPGPWLIRITGDGKDVGHYTLKATYTPAKCRTVRYPNCSGSVPNSGPTAGGSSGPGP